MILEEDILKRFYVSKKLNKLIFFENICFIKKIVGFDNKFFRIFFYYVYVKNIYKIKYILLFDIIFIKCYKV